MDAFFLEIARYEAEQMIRELRHCPMRVILKPAPEPRFEGHKVRAVDSRPPEWYMEIYGQVGRKTFKRHRFLAALERIKKGDTRPTAYTLAALKAIERILDD